MNANKIIAVAAKQLRMQSALQHIWNIDPILETVTVAMVTYMGAECLAENGEPLVNLTLSTALNAYHAAEASGEKEGTCRGRYIKSLLNIGAQVFDQHIVVSTPNGEILWSPFVCGLTEYIGKYPDSEITVRRRPANIEQNIKTIFLMTKIIPAPLLAQDSLAELLDDVKLTA
jgi:hypothetical protein